MTPLAIQRDSTTGRYIVMVDASLYKESNCLQKVWKRCFLGLTTEAKDFKMEYGTAFHKALVCYYTDKPVNEAVTAATQYYLNANYGDDWRNAAHLMNCVMDYYRVWKGGGDLLRPITVEGRPLLELPFALPFYQDPVVEVLLCGTIDMIGTYCGQRVIVDHKTTSLTKVEDYLRSYDLSPQLLTYRTAHSILFPSVSVGCMINGIFLNKTNKNSFKRSDIIHFSERHIEAHELMLHRRVASIVESFKLYLAGAHPNNAFTPNYTCCEEKYGSCMFLPSCMASTDNDEESVIANSFTTRTYDPRKFQE